MAIRFILITLFVCTLSNLAKAQLGVDATLSAIKFEGNKKSNLSYLYKNIICEVNHAVSDSLIKADVQRLNNLSGIGNATYRIDTVGRSQILVFQLEEVRTLIPILNLGRITDNLFFQVGFADINWKGKGQVLSVSYLNNDNRHSGNIFFKNPHINNSSWGFSASLSTWSSEEPLFFPEGTVFYEYGNDGVGLTGIYHINRYSNIEFGGTYFVENYERGELFSEITFGPDQLTQPKALSKLAYTVSHVNYDRFYLDGRSTFIQYQNVFNTLDNSWFHIIQAQIHSYWKHGKKGNFANRLNLGLATNSDSPFAPFVADSHVNIRGIGNRIDRGTAQVILNSEYRHTLYYKKRTAAVQGVIFSDIGTWRNPGGTLSQLIDLSEVRIFAGVGLRFIYPKIHGAVLRIDYSVELNESKTRGLVVGLGQYF